jgi:hypothetical protein
MKRILAIGALALTLSGCAQFERFTTYLASPQTTQAVANLRAGAQALVCAISNIANVTAQVEMAVDAGEAVIGNTGRVYVASAIVCASLGGVVTGTATVK